MTSTTTMTSSTTAAASGLVTHHPAVDESRTRIAAPVVSATLLEDRAQVTRRGRVDVVAGRNRLVLWDVAPTLQDVSLRVTTSNGGDTVVRVDDARARRVARVLHSEQPEAARILEEKLAELSRRHDELRDDAERVQHRASVVAEMMEKALAEVPQDAAWSIGDATAWKHTFETLSAKSRALLGNAQNTRHEMRTLSDAVNFVVEERRRIDRPDTRVLGLVEVDLSADENGSVDLILEYTVPNAIWRPTHEATLSGQTLTVASRAAVWQNTGEDWVDVNLSFSTARSSLGHEPPLLHNDVLNVQKRDNRVVVQAREVAVSRAGLGRGGVPGGGGAAASTAVDLPGVDDGGDIQHLKAAHPVSVPSTGRPSFVPLSSFQAPAVTSLLVMAEADEKAILKATCAHGGTHPMLAGPVDLLRDSGPVGSTRTLFIAPGEQLALGFGPDDDVRVKRTVESREVVDEIDQWRRRTVTVNLYLSNLGPDDKALDIVERLPVSEIEHVKVTLVADKTSGAPTLDDDGFLRWGMALAGRGRLRLSLVYVVAFAPNVTSS